MENKTPFYEQHVAAGGKMVPFAGFLMPVQYTGIIGEHRHVRSAVGLFDVSHMGEIEVWGPEALKFVSYVTINDPAVLEVDQVQYSAMCYPDAGIVDDLLVYRFPDHYFLVVNASNLDKDFAWLQEQSKFFDVTLKNTSPEVAQLALQGPKAEPLLQKICDLKLSDMKFYWFKTGKVDGIEMIVSRTGYTGEDGFELYFDVKYAGQIWEALFKAGREFNLQPSGLGARDSLRLEMKYCLYGNDIDKTTSPLEAGLGWITKLKKEGDFIGKDVLLKQKAEGVKRKLVGFEVEGNAFPRQHYKVFKDGSQVGEVVSGVFSPSVSKGIGTAYVKSELAKTGTELQVEIRGKMIPAKVAETPFWKHSSIKK
ncbi:MAG: glycine cleavage system aminomethyltransferase GcvT [Candidatus Edwardsbacteria bacterium]|nr:glycine cleavage system aminomethyltransferase GcvT [Candidatus Edwardsbacteria bacterium]MBU1576176.1 glycine cleavage system aminomethyltransferase GcvT [Candidatus Edwardsbacteria bacterium]MBU2464656.1 glycine cleavage system aminomethyltransferase GcvT [Candidatus Edwardsbacteria bacterium]MBU2594231.1 glycine cleavage system aminomethyltransferase GcvT [Candidatus Edwardsbacteria bacterium]